MKFFTLALVSIFSLVAIGAPSAASAQAYYPYYQVGQPLSCVASAATVRAGEAVTFFAQGNWGSGYNWATPDRTYLNVGPQLTTTLFTLGVQTVTVSAGAQAANCSVTVLPSGAAVTPAYQVASYPVTYFASQYVPNLPNTGFEPLTAASFGFAAVLLVAAGLFISPYVKRTLASTFR